MAKTAVQEFTKGLCAEIPPFRLVLGLCPVLAVTTGVENGIGMGVATTFVLVCSNVLISLLRNVIPKKVRIACVIAVIATFVTVVELLMQAFAYPLFLKLGIFIPLIVVNCIVLGACGSLCRQKQGHSLFCRRTRHRPWVHPVSGCFGRHPGNTRLRHVLRYAGLWTVVSTFWLYGSSAGRICMPWAHVVRYEHAWEKIESRSR